MLPNHRRYHPKLNVLYVLSECIDCNGYLTAFNVDPVTGHLTELGRLDMTGKSTCYISFDKELKHAICTNYWDGIIDIVELNHQGVPVRIVQSHQQTRRKTWRQVENREVSLVVLSCGHADTLLSCTTGGSRNSRQYAVHPWLVYHSIIQLRYHHSWLSNDCHKLLCLDAGPHGQQAGWPPCPLQCVPPQLQVGLCA